MAPTPANLLPGAVVARRRNIMGSLAPKFAVLTLAVTAAFFAFQHFGGEADSRPTHRKLYEYKDGMCDGYIETEYRWLVVGLLCWGIFYMFWALSIVCDEYFVASLEEISDVLGLSPDVAGATFMAAGSSAPELFTSLMGVFAVKNDVGVGTIVGSAVFNLCCIIGGTALFSPILLKIDWKPITRDSFFYGLSIVGMIYVLMDGTVTTIEAGVLVAFYFVYVLVMYLNESIMDAINKCSNTENMEKVDHLELDGKDGEEDEDEDGLSAKEAVLMALRQRLFEKVTMARALQQRLERTLLCKDGQEGCRPTSPDSALALLRERQYSTAGIAFGAYEGFEPDR